MTISLPTDPTGDDYEDLITATMQLLGYFTETRLVLRGGKQEVLELDVVATPLGESSASRELVEAKKGTPSFPIIFKLYGQRKYLGIPKACLVTLCASDPEHGPIYEEKGAEMGVRLCNLTLDDQTELEDLAAPRNSLSPDLRNRLTPAVWFQQIGRRQIHAQFVRMCKVNWDDDLFRRARQYHFAVQSSFFRESAVARAEALYNAYWNFPKLTGEFVSRISKSEDIQERDVWNRLWNTEKLGWLQYLVAVEHQARLWIIKNALDDIVERSDTPIKTMKIKIGGKVVGEWPLHILPQRFLEGLEILRHHPHSLKLPYLFQVFLDVFGGYLFQNDEQELALISQITQIPSSEVVEAIKILDQFFAPDGKTFFYEAKGELLCMKMVPAFMHGGGAFLRMGAYEFKLYGDRFPNMGWLLAKWHSALYKLLEQRLGSE